MAKDSFVIYKSFYKPISRLSDKQLGRLFRAIFQYQIDGEVTVEEDIEMAFEFFKNQFEIDESKYQGIVERNRNNGRNGVKKREAKQANGCNDYLNKPNRPMGAKQANGSYNVNDNVNDNDINLSFSEEKDLSVAKAPDDSTEEDCDFNALKVYFNSQLEKYNARIPRITVISAERRKMIKNRCHEHGKKAMMQVIEKAAQSNFLNGSSDFLASFDWILKPRNFIKILEGNYDNKTNSPSNNRFGYREGACGNSGAPVKGKYDAEFGLNAD